MPNYVSRAEREGGKETMAVRCVSCGQEFDAVLFEFDRWLLCECGAPVSRDFPRRLRLQEEAAREKMRELGRLADRVCCHILDESYPAVDIAVERSQLRETALAWFPGCERLYEMIYEARFQRLWEQWRADS